MLRCVGANSAGFESGQRIPHANSIASMRRAIEEAGIRLVFDRTGAAVGIVRQNADE
jgi:hypothetical protein